ncbi:MAG: hypothetical protein EXX96DRAFT_651253 [Benjaminiella poitrasii]|nr:MAG: hypothetical protein EXX96DRAFT_651253 [Benjaminiella poitrasii]
MYSMNMRYTRIHKTRPFCAMFYRQPNQLEDYTKLDKTPLAIEKMDAKQVEKNMSYIQETVLPSMAKRMRETQVKDHENFNKKHKVVQDIFPLNSKVMVVNVDRSAKTQPRFRDIPINQIKLIQSGDKTSNEELFEKHYEVRSIINHRQLKNNKYEYLTSFVGYDEAEWIIESDFDSVNTIRDYWNRRRAIERQQKGNFDLPETINQRKPYTKRHTNYNIDSEASKTNSKINSPSKADTHPTCRSNRLKK